MKTPGGDFIKMIKKFDRDRAGYTFINYLDIITHKSFLQ